LSYLQCHVVGDDEDKLLREEDEELEEEDDEWRWQSGKKMKNSRKKTTNGGGNSGSRVDAPQNPNCRSLVQGLKQQGLRSHLPSPFTVRAD
jgi:hypothetical protein